MLKHVDMLSCIYYNSRMNNETALAVTAELLPAEARPRVDHAALADAWAADLRARAAAGLLAERTAAAYARNVARWLSWLDARALALPTPADVLAYLADLRMAGLKPASVNAYLDAVRGLYRWTETRNAYPAIARSVRGLAVRKDEPLDCLDRDAVAGLLAYTDGESLRGLRDAALVRVLFSTGLRLVSLCALNVADLDAGDAVLTYTGKGDRDAARRAYLAPGALDALVRYLAARRDACRVDPAPVNDKPRPACLAPDAPLFAAVGNRAGGDRLTARSVRRVIVALMEAAGHVKRDAAGKIDRPRVLSAHSLRRSAITAAFDAAGLDAAQTLAGHADPKTTRRAYARVQKGRVLRGLAGALDLDAGKGVA
jgi:site-specific recombinase XerD